MKKEYIKPMQRIVVIHRRAQLLQASVPVENVYTNVDNDNDTNDDFHWGGAGDVEGR